MLVPWVSNNLLNGLLSSLITGSDVLVPIECPEPVIIIIIMHWCFAYEGCWKMDPGFNVSDLWDGNSEGNKTSSFNRAMA